MPDSDANSSNADLVSIIMPAHNSARFITETIESVRAQTYTNWELIVVDDCSSDETLEILKKFRALDPRIRYVALEHNSGAAVARNTAIEETRGRYIAFLDSDDLWLPQKLERQLAFMAETGCPFTYTSYERISEAGESLSFVHVPPETSYSALLKKNVIGCLTAIYDSAELGKTFMPLIRMGQDFGFWLMLLRLVHWARGLYEILGQYRIRENSISSNKLESSKWVWRLYREVMGLSVPAAAYNFAFYATTGVLSRASEKLVNRKLTEEQKRAPRR